jgi:hypothetical protein
MLCVCVCVLTRKKDTSCSSKFSTSAHIKNWTFNPKSSIHESYKSFPQSFQTYAGKTEYEQIIHEALSNLTKFDTFNIVQHV